MAGQIIDAKLQEPKLRVKVTAAGMVLCGIDEVGRGALAGPLVGCGVIFKWQFWLFEKLLDDSKKLSRARRERVYALMLNTDTQIKMEIITVEEINQYGMAWANKELFRRIINQTDADEYVLDGNIKLGGELGSKAIRSVIKADSWVPEVMAASIVAKVTRDKLMRQLAGVHSQYGWETNMGYGTREHIKSLAIYGPCSQHRSKFVNAVFKKSKIK